MKPTMTDVAKEAGVSQTTVSFILSGKNIERIPKETQEKVWTAAKKLNYRMQSTAQSLVTGKTGTIGLLYDETYEYLIHDGFCSSVFLGIQNEIKKHDLRLSFGTINNLDNYLPVMLETYSVDGVIFLAAKSDKVIEILQMYQIPTILVDPARKHSGLTEIEIDNGTGAEQAITHLLELKHKRIGCVSAKYESMDYEPISFIERRKGYEKTLQQYGIPLDPSLIIIGEIWYTDRSTNMDPAYRAGYDSMVQILRLETPPTAVFTVNDRLALGALAGARDNNIAVPESMSIIGFDDIPESSRTVPPLTTISVPKKELGETAVKQLLALIENDKVTPAEYFLETKLINRSSTAPLLK